MASEHKGSRAVRREGGKVRCEVARKCKEHIFIYEFIFAVGEEI